MGADAGPAVCNSNTVEENPSDETSGTAEASEETASKIAITAFLN